MPNPRLYLIDVSGLVYRAYYAISGLSTSYGQPTGAIFGFVNILNKILKVKPDYVVCCFDVSRDTFRQKKFKEYKMNRPPSPAELIHQMQYIREVVDASNIASAEQDGYEADDVIASFAHKASQHHIEVVIVSSDKDILQLVDDGVRVFDPKKDKGGLFYDKQQVKERYGVWPNQIIDMFTLMGDSADNIPGIKGIGEKTASALIQEFGTIENLITHADAIPSPGLREAIKGNIAAIRLNYDLLKLTQGLDINFDLKRLAYKEADHERLFLLFKKLEFHSLLKKLSAQKGIQAPMATNIEPLEQSSRKESILRELADAKEFVFVLEADTVYFSFEESAFSVAVKDTALRQIIANPAIRKISHNIKDAEYTFLRKHIPVAGFSFDTMLSAYLLEPSLPEFSLNEVAFKYLEKSYSPNTLSPAESIALIVKLRPLLEGKLKEQALDSLFYTLELPVSSVLAQMQVHGVKIDAKQLGVLSGELEKKLIRLRYDIYALNAGDEFNLNSPKQLADVLFTKLKLPIVKKGKTGPSTDEEVLRKLSKNHALPQLILEYRSIAKLKNTYVDSLPELIDTATHRIHATFDQTGTETGRLSSNNPNLQNIPARADAASLIRKAFIAEDGYCLVSADYSQIELRVLAHFSGDDTLIAAFKNDVDIHRHTASLIFQVDEQAVSDEMRDTAKRINFGIIYGMSNFGLAKDLGIAPQEAQSFIDSYFARYPKVKEFIEKQITVVKKLGYATTLLGRRRYLPEIQNRNNTIRSFAERQAVNSPIQGSAADLIKLAMVAIQSRINEKKLKSKIIMQIHDELVLEVLQQELKEIVALLHDKMESAYELLVPIKVNVKQGANWFEMYPV